MCSRRSVRLRDKEKSEGIVKRSVQWEWESDDGGWTAFDRKNSDIITASLNRGKHHLIIEGVRPVVKLELHFSSMSQVNLSTGKERNIRCVPWPSSLSDQWEWQDEHRKWNLYPPVIQRLLGACHLCGVDQWEVEALGKKYNVELENKVQINVETGVKRKVRCVANGSRANKEGGASIERNQRKKQSTKKMKIENSTSSSNGGVSKGGASDSVVDKSNGGVSKGSKGGASDSGVDETDDRVLVTYRGKVPVDYECHAKIGKAHVYSEGGEHWDATLNQTNLKNNNNKFYILQLLQDNSNTTSYCTWFRWGRVGKTGQNTLTECGSDLENAKKLFTKKFYDKTGNKWEDRESFVARAGKYDLLSMDYEPKEAVDGEASEEVMGGVTDNTEPLESKLDERVQALIELICDVKSMEETVLEMKYDARKAPLGKLTTDQVRCGYAALKKIEDCITRNLHGDPLFNACNEFYTRIPHDFGMRRPPLITTKEQVKEKLALLETLSDIQIAMTVLTGGDKREHPIDRHYHELNCTLNPVDQEDSIFRLVEKYVRQTHARTHSKYRLEVQEIFEVERQGEAEKFKDRGNRYLLWHGSRLSNWVGILSQGLRIAPPEAPITGYMFGKGIYFADMCSKSSNYCFASKTKNEGLAVLCDVSLGHTQDLLASNFSADQLPKGKHSTKGLGKLAPDPAQNHTLHDGCIVPLGTPIDTGVENPSGYTLNYNEFIVYDPGQVKMRFLVKLKFHFV